MERVAGPFLKLRARFRKAAGLNLQKHAECEHLETAAKQVAEKVANISKQLPKKVAEKRFAEKSFAEKILFRFVGRQPGPAD